MLPAVKERGMRLEVRVLLVVLVLATAATLLATSRYGVGLTPDSVVYVDGAQNMADGLGFSRHGETVTIFAPGYSAVLSIGERLGLGVLGTARAVGVIAFVLTTVLGFVLLRRHVRSRYIVAAGTIVIGCSAILLAVFKQALSDQLFIAVTLLLILVAEEVVRRPRSLWLLAGAVALVWGGFYLRYAGIVLVPFIAAVVLVTTWPQGWLRAVVRTGALSILALSAPVWWMLRNVDAGGDIMGARQDATATPLTNVRRTALMLSGWVSFDGPTALRALAFLAILVGLAGVVLLALPLRAKVASRTRELWPIGFFVGLYIVYLIATASVVAFAPIHNRYLIPVYVPLVVLGAWTFERVRARLGRTAQQVLTAVAVVWIGANVVWFGIHAVRAQQDGAGGYSTVAWHESALMEDVRQWAPDRPLVSNDIKAVQLFADRVIPETAARTYVGSADSTGDMARFVAAVACEGEIGLAWFSEPGARGRLYTPEQLAEHLEVVPITTRDDGVLYSVTPLATNDGEDDADAGGDCSGFTSSGQP
jgi:hypothetical protein